MDITQSNHFKNFSFQHFIDLEKYINSKSKEIKQIKEQRSKLEEKLMIYKN